MTTKINALYNKVQLDRLHVMLRQAGVTAAALPLRDFIRAAWHVCEPATAYVHGWHIDAISEHLTAVTNGEIRNLLINIPPRHMKSLSVSVFWPCWVWTFRPDVRWLFASYADSLSVRDSLKCRRLIQSLWYQRQWSAVYQLTGDQNAKTHFENNQGGYRLASGIGGSITGRGARFLVCDDPHKILESESDAQREKVLIWWDETMSTRMDDPKTGAKVIIMQRLHERDLSGHVLAQGGYEHLCLPAEYEPAQRVTAIGWTDPRREAGELLWPERYGRVEIEALKHVLGTYGSAGQLQQRPAPRGGGLFKRDWFHIVESAPRVASRVRYWDKAATEEGQGSTSYTCGVLLARDESGINYIEDVVRGQWSTGQREAIIRQVAETDAIRYGHEVRIWVEQEPGSGGKDSAIATIRNLAGFIVYADRVTGSKIVRAEPLASQAEIGNLRLVRADWNRDLIERFCVFPAGTYKDEIDAASGAFNKLPRVTASVSDILDKVTQPAPSRFNVSPRGNKWKRR